MTKVRIHNPCNEHTRYYRYYNYFWDKFTDYLKEIFDVEENRYYEHAHSERFPVTLQKGISDNFLLLECEYIIENIENGEFVIMSVADELSHSTINENKNPLLKKVLISQFLPKRILSHIGEDYSLKYSPWTYFPAHLYDLEEYYNKRQTTPPSNDQIYFRGTSLEDRKIIHYIDKEIITPFNPIVPDQYFNELITHKIALSVDGRGEFCYRDIECFACGVPIIRYDFESIFYDPLIPNFHYISIPRPDDMVLYRAGNEEHAKKLVERYKEVINDDEFLNFIAKNAREYYEKNCKLDSVMVNTFNMLDIKHWL